MLRVNPENPDVNIHIRKCCADFTDAVMMNPYRQGIIKDEDGQIWLWWSDGDMTPLRYCPCCGKEIEIMKESDEDDGISQRQ